MEDKATRLRSAINWLIYSKLAESSKDIANQIGRNESYFSQVLNNPDRISEKFIDAFCRKYEMINPVWLLVGEGEMVRSTASVSHNTINNSTNSVIGGDNIVHNASTDKLIDELSALRKTFERFINQQDSIIQKLLADRDKS